MAGWILSSKTVHLSHTSFPLYYASRLSSSEKWQSHLPKARVKENYNPTTKHLTKSMPQRAAFILATFLLEGLYVTGPKWKMFDSSQRRCGYPADTLGHAPY